jgi:hypothetical protein
MARLNVFVVSFICFVRGAMLNRAHTKEHFSRLPYSAGLLAPRGLLHALSELRRLQEVNEALELIDPSI